MFGLLCKTLPYPYVRECGVRASPTPKLCYLQNHPLVLVFSLRSISTSTKSNQHSFTVSYLINSLGFSPETALSTSKYVNFETPDKPDTVLAFFNNHGFSKAQISKIIRTFPPVLSYDTQKTLLPKLHFFYSRGVSTSDLAKILSTSPTILQRSLENHIIPSFNFFNTLLKSDEKAIATIKRFSRILLFDLQTYLVANINVLRDNGVPESNIVMLLKNQPRVFMTNSDQFKEIVEKVKKMGFDPLRVKFVLAVQALRAMSKSTWERKVHVYKNWGWSEEEIRIAFGKNPWCMMASEDKDNGSNGLLCQQNGLGVFAYHQTPRTYFAELRKEDCSEVFRYSSYVIGRVDKERF